MIFHFRNVRMKKISKVDKLNISWDDNICIHIRSVITIVTAMT